MMNMIILELNNHKNHFNHCSDNVWRWTI